MEVYKREAGEILRRFMSRQISDRECITALDSTVVSLISTLKPEDIGQLRASVLANCAIVKQEMARRRTVPAED